MISNDKNIIVTFNGEIYNHRDLREEITKNTKIKWQTKGSDTEVILRAYMLWGINCVSKFRGMFSFSIYDKRNDSLYLVRDRIGIKPLYYYNDGSRIVFGSEIKAILLGDRVPREMNQRSLYHYLSFLTVPAPNTMFEGINKMLPGHYIRIDRNGYLEQNQYYDLLETSLEQDVSKLHEKALTSIVLSELRKSVQLRKIADVPVGVFLSGGIDSTTNAALFNEDSNEKVKSFAIDYDVDYSL